uniref:Odorant receptor n=1 Tax=Hedya nubiferana TaxID=572853 RepID=A0A223HD07_9NEOP|nr:putative odorant receptor OR10 [Hedya nubiferana]
MIVQKIISFSKILEDPKHPLLGPNLKGLYVYGLWQSGSKFRNSCYNFIHFCAFLFVISQLIELWVIRRNLLEALHNLSLTALGMVCIFKAVSYVIWQSDWKELVEGISAEEITQKDKLNDTCAKLKQNYTNYARIVTYLYWNVVVSTNVTMVSAPFLKYATTSEYREQISNGTEPLPQIFSSWFPFDKTTMPGYSVAIFVHILINIHGGGVIALYDSNAVAVMVFIKGQLAILREKCQNLFDDYGELDRQITLDRIKECHRHHNFILRHSTLFNSLLSPVMFLYVLVCSGMICCSVVQFTSDEATAAQKIWVLQYTTALVSQLFLYCWHSNEVVVECQHVDGGVYNSEWWKGDVRIRKQLAMLGGKLTHGIAFSAGPFTTLCLPTFIDVGSKTKYYLVTKIKDKKKPNALCYG